MYNARQCTQTIIIKQCSVSIMSQQAGTSSTHNLVDDNNSCASNNNTQVLFPSDNCGSKQKLEFLLCKSCFWCATSYITTSNSGQRYINTCQCCNHFSPKFMLIANIENDASTDRVIVEEEMLQMRTVLDYMSP